MFYLHFNKSYFVGEYFTKMLSKHSIVDTELDHQLTNLVGKISSNTITVEECDYFENRSDGEVDVLLKIDDAVTYKVLMEFVSLIGNNEVDVEII